MDKYAGQGGSYKIDKDGNRVLVERTGEVIEQKAKPEYSKKTKAKKTTPKEG